MCGICGQYNFIGQAPVLLDDIKTMTRTLIHRGPDDEGYHLDGNLGLGFRRLSIIDLAGGHQPMADAEETVWVIFNGEIYNFQELRAELESRGHRFRTKSDTEPIVHGSKGIQKLAPGTMLVFEKGQAKREPWYPYTPIPFEKPKAEDEACEELIGLYRDAMRRHLISDVPVGLLLSGGIDSGLLLALMNLYGSAWSTYTIGYGSSYADDELTEASETARILGSKHTIVRITRSIFEETLPKIVA